MVCTIWKRFSTFTILFALAALTGCGGDSGPTGPKFDLVPVTGTVTLDGAPLEGATVTYAFVGTPPEGYYGSAGISDAQGKYTVMTGQSPGALVGDYKVFVSKLVDREGGPAKIDPDSGMDLEMLQMQGDVKEMIPPQFSDPQNTTLTASVSASGPNEHTQTLTSK